jgi:anti-sigma regulatory factor (Ser/Thr protein kinase)
MEPEPFWSPQSLPAGSGPGLQQGESSLWQENRRSLPRQGTVPRGLRNTVFMPRANEAGVQVRLAGGYPLAQIERFIRDIGPLLSIDEAAEVEIDLEGLAFVGPTALTVMTATLRHLSHNRLLAEDARLYMPRSPLTRHYLERMDFVRLVAKNADEYEEEFERRDPVGFRPCQHFDGSEYHVVAAEMANAVAERCETDTVARSSIRICFDELAENVLNHADTPLGGFAMAQAWPRRSEIEVAIVDLGIGVRASLAKNPAYAALEDDLAAVTVALDPRVTGNPTGRNSGIGLYITRLLLRENGGTLLLRSGRGEIYSGSREEGFTRANFFPGTIVALRARLDRPLDINRVYRELENADNRNDDA